MLILGVIRVHNEFDQYSTLSLYTYQTYLFCNSAVRGIIQMPGQCISAVHCVITAILCLVECTCSISSRHCQKHVTALLEMTVMFILKLPVNLCILSGKSGDY